MLHFTVLTVEVSVHTGCIMLLLCIFFKITGLCAHDPIRFTFTSVSCLCFFFFFFQCQHFQHNLKTVRQVTAEVLKSLNSVSF